MAQADTGSVQPLTWMVARESVDLEFQPRAPKQYLDGLRKRVADELLAVDGCAGYAFRTLQDELTRGGPVTESPQNNWANIGFSTDGRKWLSFDLNGGHDWNEQGAFSTNGGLSMNLKPLSSLSISTGPSLTRSKNLTQYLQTEDDPIAVATFGQRYVFGTIDQTQLTLQTRVNWVLNPKASLQVFMQPLLASGRYDDPSRRSVERDRGRPRSPTSIGTVTVTGKVSAWTTAAVPRMTTAQISARLATGCSTPMPIASTSPEYELPA